MGSDNVSFCSAGPVGLDASQEAACAAKMMFGFAVCRVLGGGWVVVRQDGRRRRRKGGWQA